MDGKNEQSNEVKSPERDKGTNDAMNEPFGPWMQVSYGRQGRGNLGPNQNGNKNGNSGKNGNGFRYTNGTPTPGAGNYGKVGSGTKNVNEPSTSGAENSRQTMGNIKDIAEEVTAVEGQTSVDSQEKVLPSNILTEISNQDFGNKKKTAPFANKYLAHPVTGKGVYNKQLKENVNDKWGKKTGKGLSQPSSTTPSTQPISMDEDIDDSGVLQSLHKNILDSEVPESSNQEIRPPPLFISPSPQPPVHCGREVVSTGPSQNQSIEKRKSFVAEPSCPISKRERSPVPALWEHIRHGICQISFDEDKEIPLAKNKRPRASEVGAASNEETQEVVNLAISVAGEVVSNTIPEKTPRVAFLRAVPFPKAHAPGLGASNLAPYSAREVIIVMSNGLTFFGALS
ncbi:hypothetical protein LWI29_006539 [Acer saccharum]|uniref:Uncharacterized protein n=1 Tax=Acer saccharum TaxID=4024 RepID=A0AA39RGI7_ACESA|nr:hypothetical protein LWI29_006539 [Acer saccharum]